MSIKFYTVLMPDTKEYGVTTNGKGSLKSVAAMCGVPVKNVRAGMPSRGVPMIGEYKPPCTCGMDDNMHEGNCAIVEWEKAKRV